MQFSLAKSYLLRNLVWIIPLAIIFTTGLFFRVYRMSDLLGFYYDSARDALVVHKIIYENKLTLIGPTTGIEGIFLGPFYYYLLVPSYLIGGGDPAVAASWISFINALAILGLFFVGKKLFNKVAGLTAAFLFAFSWNEISFARWFANPSPLPIFVCLIFLSIVNLRKQKKVWWIVLASSIALSLQIEAAAGVWFIPATLISLVVLKIKPNPKWIIISGLVFFILSSPLLLFDLKHDFVIFKSFQRFLLTEKSFQASFWDTVKLRIPFYTHTLGDALRFDLHKTIFTILGALLTIFVYLRKKAYAKGKNLWGIWILVIWIAVPLIGFLFYQGNNGYVWNYYLSGIMPAFYLILGFSFSVWLKKYYLMPLAIIFILLFLNNNFSITKGYLAQGEPGENGVQFRNQKQAIDFVYQDAKPKDFNLDVYVPPVIPYTYDYLTLWYGQKKYRFTPKVSKTSLLYVIEEVDPPHPERLKAFVNRQNSFSKLISTKRFGGIIVEKRIRF